MCYYLAKVEASDKKNLETKMRTKSKQEEINKLVISSFLL